MQPYISPEIWMKGSHSERFRHSKAVNAVWVCVPEDDTGFGRMLRIRRSNIQILGDLGKKVNFAVIGAGKKLEQVSESSGDCKLGFTNWCIATAWTLILIFS